MDQLKSYNQKHEKIWRALTQRWLFFYIDREPPEGERGGAAVLRDGSSNDLLSGDLPHARRIYITSSHILQHISNVLNPFLPRRLCPQLLWPGHIPKNTAQREVNSEC